jgi:formylglycine-generating enzyme required for sulfatase activity/serine/threonine protein kinase
MDAKPTTHPPDETLVSYGLGKLDDTLAESVSQHLEQCDPCRRRVAELSSDSFVARLQNAKRRQDSKPSAAPRVRTKTLVESAPAAPSPAPDKQPPVRTRSSATSPSASGNVLPELVNHPQYEVIRELGRGGMGVVYLARNKIMDRLEVLKVLNRETLAKQGTTDRFLREIQSAAKLHHANVVAAYTAFTAGELLVFGMEYVEGEDLGKLVRARGPLPVLNACYFAYQAAQGLQHAHERGMIHRDIKPGNLILLREGKKATVKILDFGLAKVKSEHGLDRSLTQTGQMLGTPDYIAPEQTLDAQKADIRADIYSLGCTLYHLLTGNPPFIGNSLYEVLQAHHSTDPKPLNLVRPEVPPELAAVVAKMLAKEVDRRYQTPAEVAQALKPFLKPGGLSSPAPEISQIGSTHNRPSEPLAKDQAGDDEAALSLAPMAAIEPAERWKSLLDLPAFERSSAIRKAVGPAPRRAIPWMWPAIAAGGLAAMLTVLWACGVFSVKTKEGVIVVKNLPPDAEVFVDDEKVLLTLPKDGPAEISVATGTHTLQVKQGSVVVRGQKVMIANGGREVIDAEFKPVANTESSKSPTIIQDDMHNATAPPLLVAPFEKTAAREGQERWAAHLHAQVEVTNTIGMKLTLIPPGRFPMGSSETIDELLKVFPKEKPKLGERPVHIVTISKPIYVGIFEVTKEQFRRFVEDTGYRTDAEKDGKGGRGYRNGQTHPWSSTNPAFTWRDWGADQPDNAPVVNVSYNDATAFCRWLSNKEGTSYRLPTEAEWEYACRAGTLGRSYNGNDPRRLTEIGNVRDETIKSVFPGLPEGAMVVESSDGFVFPAPVGHFQPNSFGLFDMIGNVWEWCTDWYDEDYYLTSPAVDPPGPTSGTNRVNRGGSWFAGGSGSRSARRGYQVPDARDPFMGFRVALSIPDSMKSSVTATTAPLTPQAPPIVKDHRNSAAPAMLVAPFNETIARQGQDSWAQHLKTERETTNTVGMKLVLLPPGQFEMGSSDSVEQLKAAFPVEGASNAKHVKLEGEWPVHKVTISRPFYLGKYEVTKRQFRQFVEEAGFRSDAERSEKGCNGFTVDGDKLVAGHGSNFTWRDWGVEQSEDAPVVNISHTDAAEFCVWLSKKERRSYRLPTEAEWEYACRAGTTSRYYNGNDPVGLTKIGNVRDATWRARFPEGWTEQAALGSSDGYVFPAPVGQFPPNNFGLYDMLGNAWEYCADWYDETYYLHSPEFDPPGPPTGQKTVFRGGAWSAGAMQSRVARRQYREPDIPWENTGFRIALTIPDAPTVAASNALPSADGGANVPHPGESRLAPLSTSVPAHDVDGFVPLVNADDLEGWHKIHSDTIDWFVSNGMVVGVNHGKAGDGGLIATDCDGSRRLRRLPFPLPSHVERR